VQILPGPQFDIKDVISFLLKRIRHHGFIRRQPLESLTVHPLVWRPFLRVRWRCTSSKPPYIQTRYSLLDEQSAALVSEFNERLLLWRPRIATLEPVKNSVEPTCSLEETIVKKNKLQAVIDDLIQQRTAAQQSIGQINPNLRRLQADPLSALRSVLPRQLIRGRREQELAEQYQKTHSIVLATSIVTNCAQEDSIEQGVLEERVAIGTMMAEYRDLETNALRIIFLETANVKSLTEALFAGRALTRLCQLNSNCQKMIRTIFDYVSDHFHKL